MCETSEHGHPDRAAEQPLGEILRSRGCCSGGEGGSQKRAASDDPDSEVFHGVTWYYYSQSHSC